MPKGAQPGDRNRPVPSFEQRPRVMVDAIWEAHAAFLAADPLPQPNLEFWLNLLDQQVVEAREHLAAGRVDKVHAELADMVSVAFRALHVEGVEPESFVARRIRERVIPKARAIAERDRAGNGYKEARAPPPSEPACVNNEERWAPGERCEEVVTHRGKRYGCCRGSGHDRGAHPTDHGLTVHDDLGHDAYDLQWGPLGPLRVIPGEWWSQEHERAVRAEGLPVQEVVWR